MGAYIQVQNEDGVDSDAMPNVRPANIPVPVPVASAAMEDE